MANIGNKKVLGAVALVVIMLMACGDSLWDDLPSPISQFVTKYYPNTSIASYSDANGVYKVTIKSGPTMTFDSDYNWTMVDGNGVALPAIFVLNEMPDIYNFLLARDEVNTVMKADNQPRAIYVTLPDRCLEYIKETGEIRPYIPEK